MTWNRSTTGAFFWFLCSTWAPLSAAVISFSKVIKLSFSSASKKIRKTLNRTATAALPAALSNSTRPWWRLVERRRWWLATSEASVRQCAKYLGGRLLKQRSTGSRGCCGLEGANCEMTLTSDDAGDVDWAARCRELLRLVQRGG